MHSGHISRTKPSQAPAAPLSADSDISCTAPSRSCAHKSQPQHVTTSTPTSKTSTHTNTTLTNPTMFLNIPLTLLTALAVALPQRVIINGINAIIPIAPSAVHHPVAVYPAPLKNPTIKGPYTITEQPKYGNWNNAPTPKPAPAPSPPKTTSSKAKPMSTAIALR